MCCFLSDLLQLIRKTASIIASDIKLKDAEIARLQEQIGRFNQHYVKDQGGLSARHDGDALAPQASGGITTFHDKEVSQAPAVRVGVAADKSVLYSSATGETPQQAASPRNTSSTKQRLREEQWRRQLIKALEAMQLKLSSSGEGVTGVADDGSGTSGCICPSSADDLSVDTIWRSHGMAWVKECVRGMAASVEKVLGDLVAAREGGAVSTALLGEERRRTRELEAAAEARSFQINELEASLNAKEITEKELEESRKRVTCLESEFDLASAHLKEYKASSEARIAALESQLAEDAARRSEATLGDRALLEVKMREDGSDTSSPEDTLDLAARLAQAEATLASERELSESLGGEVEKLQARMSALQQDHIQLKREAFMLSERAALIDQEREQDGLVSEEVLEMGYEKYLFNRVMLDDITPPHTHAHRWSLQLRPRSRL